MSTKILDELTKKHLESFTFNTWNETNWHRSDGHNYGSILSFGEEQAILFALGRTAHANITSDTQMSEFIESKLDELKKLSDNTEFDQVITHLENIVERINEHASGS